MRSYKIQIKVASSETVRSAGIGSLDLPLWILLDEDIETLELSNVIYAPDLNANLLSIDQLNESSFGVTLLPKESEIFDIKIGRHIAKINCVNNLYKVNVSCISGEIEEA